MINVTVHLMSLFLHVNGLKSSGFGCWKEKGAIKSEKLGSVLVDADVVSDRLF